MSIQWQSLIDRYFDKVIFPATATVTAALTGAVGWWLKDQWSKWQGRKRLRNLSEREKAFFRAYFDSGSRTIHIDWDDAVAVGLEDSQTVKAHAVRERTTIEGRRTPIPYTIKPWAWDYLDKHPTLLMLTLVAAAAAA
jgi:hypothetical protein